MHRRAEEHFVVPPREFDHIVITDVQMRPRIVPPALMVINRIEREDHRGVEFLRLLEAIDETPLKLSIRRRVLPLDPQPPSHEPERNALQEIPRHRPLRRREGGDVDVAVDDHSVRYCSCRCLFCPRMQQIITGSLTEELT